MKNARSYESYLKSPYQSRKHNTYFEAYDHFFSKYRDQEITFVEIGVLGGGSLYMWRDYFGPKARIIGIDLNPNAKKWEAEGFEIFIGSQSDIDFWSKFTKEVGLIDAVLDDGGHTYEQQIITTESLLGSMNDHVIIVVEDTHTSYMDGFGPKSKSFLDYTKKLSDSINMRFEAFEKMHSERRVWSVEIVESMVAFRINKEVSSLISEETHNGGSFDGAECYRWAGREEVEKFKTLYISLNFLKHIPFAKAIAQMVLNYLAGRKFKAARFFK